MKVFGSLLVFCCLASTTLPEKKCPRKPSKCSKRSFRVFLHSHFADPCATLPRSQSCKVRPLVGRTNRSHAHVVSSHKETCQTAPHRRTPNPTKPNPTGAADHPSRPRSRRRPGKPLIAAGMPGRPPWSPTSRCAGSAGRPPGWPRGCAEGKMSTVSTQLQEGTRNVDRSCRACGVSAALRVTADHPVAVASGGVPGVLQLQRFGSHLRHEGPEVVGTEDEVCEPPERVHSLQ